jgi:hypothetical protein
MITKEQFEAAHNKYSPSKIESFYFKYFSTSTLQVNNWLTWLVAGILFIPLLLGFIFTILNKPNDVIKIPGLIYAVLLTLFGIPWICVWFAHINRIRKIRKELDVTKEEYEKLVDLYYLSQNEYLIDSIKNKAK